MKALVTGGAGFIGSHLVDRLLREGIKVRVLDNFSTGCMENLAAVAPNIEVVEGDICDLQKVREAMRGIDMVFHEAARCSVTRSVEDPQTTNVINTDGTLNVLLAARDEKVKRVVFASSSSVYGNNPALPKQEDQTPAPASPYAVTKLAGELYCHIFHQLFGMETFALRYFNVFGPRQLLNSPYAAVIPRFIGAFLKGDSPIIYGDGQQSRDFSYVTNVVEANLLAMRANSGFGEAFNVACGERTTVKQLANYLRELTGASIQPVQTPMRPGDVLHSLADITKAEMFLGYRPIADLPHGLSSTVEWYRKQIGGTQYEPAAQSITSSRR